LNRCEEVCSQGNTVLKANLLYCQFAYLWPAMMNTAPAAVIASLATSSADAAAEDSVAAFSSVHRTCARGQQHMAAAVQRLDDDQALSRVAQGSDFD